MSQMHDHGSNSPSRSALPLGASALRSSALRRLAFVAAPAVFLWIVVALALDLFAR